jgi:hypothetical protein
VKRTGLPPIRPHDICHGYATLLAKAKIPAKTVSAMLGHANIRVTLDLYTHLDLVDPAGAVEVLDAALGGGDQIRDPAVDGTPERGADAGCSGGVGQSGLYWPEDGRRCSAARARTAEIAATTVNDG